MGRRNVPGGKWACACCCRCCWVAAAAAAAAAERATDEDRDEGPDVGEDEVLSDGIPPSPPALPGGNTVPQPELAGLLLLPLPLPAPPPLVSGIPRRALSSSLQAGCPPLLELSTSETPLSAGLGGSEPAQTQEKDKEERKKEN